MMKAMTAFYVKLLIRNLINLGLVYYKDSFSSSDIERIEPYDVWHVEVRREVTEKHVET